MIFSLNRSDIKFVIRLAFSLPNMAEFRAAHTISRRDGHNCQPKGLDHGFE